MWARWPERRWRAAHLARFLRMSNGRIGPRTEIAWPWCAMWVAATGWSIPIGKVLYETSGGWISYPRVSPKGDFVAFMDHPNQGDDGGSVAVVDVSGHKKELTREWYGTQGLAWSPDGQEVWFTASELGLFHYITAVNLSGKQRLVTRVPGSSGDLRYLARRTGAAGSR